MKVEVFSSPQCHYCEQAKRILREKGIAFENRDIAQDDNNRIEFLQRLPRVRSLPQIFIDGAHIGGFEDLEILNNNGKLDQIIAPGEPAKG